MSKKKLKKSEIIDETVDFYCNNERALYGDNCAYINHNGARCAHSRCLLKKCLDSIVRKNFNTNYNAKNIIEQYGDICHKVSYRGHSWSFWIEIQNLHDVKYYWEKTDTGNKLTSVGEDFVKYLKNKYKNNEN